MRVFLTILGILLLLPGACGLLVSGVGIADHLKRATFRMDDYEEIIWLIAQPSVMAGCLGLYVLTLVTKNDRLWRITRFAGWAALAGSVAATVMAGLSGYLRSGGRFDNETFLFAIWFAIAFGIGGLPAMLVRRPPPGDGQA